MAATTHIKFGDNLEVTDEGGGVIRVDGSGGPAGPAGPTGPAGPEGPPGTTPDISGKVDKDSVVVAATRLVQSRLLAGDTHPAFRILGDGKIEWGQGGSTATDTNLYRDPSVTGTLKTDGGIRAAGAFDMNTGTNRIILNTDGRIYFGVGADTTLSRVSAGELQTGGGFSSTGRIRSSADTASQIELAADGKIKLGSSGDVALYRVGAYVLEANAGFNSLMPAFDYAAFVAKVTGDSIPRLLVQADGRIEWGPGTGVRDTFLWRSGAAQLTMSFAGLGNRALVYGAADSGGAGYRTVRVAN